MVKDEISVFENMRKSVERYLAKADKAYKKEGLDLSELEELIYTNMDNIYEEIKSIET